MQNILRFILLFLTIACASTENQMEPDRNYRMMMGIDYNGKQALGMMVLPSKDSYLIEFDSPGRLDLFTFKTCSRDVAIEKAGGFFKKDKTKYYYARNDLEKMPACDVEIWGFDKKKGRHALGYIVIEHEQNKLPAHVICGDINVRSNGVSACQGHIGFKQRISFNTTVIFTTTDQCKNGIMEKEKGYEIRLPLGICNFVFIDRNGLSHRFVTYGHEDTMVME